MSRIYVAQLQQPDEGNTYVFNTINVAGNTITFEFKWASASEEQFNMVRKWIDQQAYTDPIIIGNTFVTEYDWLEFYYKLRNMSDSELITWVHDPDTQLPKSLQTGEDYSRLVLIKERIAECVSLYPVVQQYKEIMRWQFKSTFNGEVNVGAIEIGGWYRNQDSQLSFRFVSDLEAIGYNDLGNVEIEFEIKSV